MSEIPRALNALQKLVAGVGMENMLLGNETLRPLLLVMQNVAERHGNGVMAFELGNGGARLSDRLHLGLIVRPEEYPTYRREMDEAMSDELVAVIKANDKRMVAMMLGSAVVLYHDELWIPSAALLPERKH
jgi:hypothetical protein